MSRRESTGFGCQPNQTSLKLDATAWKEVLRLKKKRETLDGGEGDAGKVTCFLFSVS